MIEKAMQESASLRTGYFSKDTFRQKSSSILVLKTGVAGTYFHIDKETEEGQKLMQSLVPGTELKLYRDPNNEHDKWAVAVYTPDDIEIGYITRFKNETISRLMDYGKTFHAYVDEPHEEPKDDTERRRTQAPTEHFDIPISIYMDD